MTVSELVESLQRMPADLDVIYVDSVVGPDVIGTVWLRVDPAPRCVVLE
jgi:hypothetical protein